MAVHHLSYGGLSTFTFSSLGLKLDLNDGEAKPREAFRDS